LRFGPVPIDEALGAVVAHAVRHPALTLKKGQIVSAAHVVALKEASVSEIIVAKLEAGDVSEDDAARRLAERLAGPNVRCERAFTGRVNLFAERAGLAMIDVEAITRVNAISEAITAATLAPYSAVAADDMIATVKIIPFAVAGAALEASLDAAGRGPVAVAAYVPKRVGVVSTLLPGLKLSVVDKTLRILGQRLTPTAAKITGDTRVAHEVDALAGALKALEPDSDLVVIFGASAITDRRDVIPAAIEALGGRIEHFGMPVDPGNLLLLGSLGGKPIVGAPGCARSPRENGFDWVLRRLLANVPIGGADIRAMGVGGLLKEIATRPQPRLGDG